jgi:hypothetical protein
MTMGAQGRPGLRAEWPKPKPKLQHGMASVLGCHKQFCHGTHAARVLAHGLRGWDRGRRGGSMRPTRVGKLIRVTLTLRRVAVPWRERRGWLACGIFFRGLSPEDSCSFL